jgi:uncharacterized protein (TIGR01777 family)
VRILITGATGFIGSALCEALDGSGHQLNVLTRDVAGARGRIPRAALPFGWDPVVGPPPPDALADVEVVINLAGEPANGRWTEEKKRTIWESRVVGTRHLVEGLRVAEPRPASLLSASAIGYYGDRGDEELLEDSAPGSDFLSSVCRDWEAAASEAEELGIVVCRPRFAIVLGRDGGAFPKLRTVTRMGIGGPIGSGRQWWSWIHIDDLVGLLLHVIEAPVAGPLNVSTPEPVRQREFARASGRAFGRPSIVPAPSFAIRTVVGGFSVELLSSRRVIPQRAQELGYRFQHATLGSALRDLTA